MNGPDCFRNDEELNLFLDKELPAGRIKALDDHLGLCRGCSLKYAISARLKNNVRSACGEAMAPGWLRERIMNEIAGAPRFENFGFWHGLKSVLRGRPLIPVGAAVVLVAAFLMTLYIRPGLPSSMQLVKTMVDEHNEYLESFESQDGIKSSDPSEITKWVASSSGIQMRIPTGGEMPPLNSACAIYEDGKHVTCVFFDEGAKRVSLFMVKDDNRPLPAESRMTVKDTALQCGAFAGRNYVAWKCNGLVSVLVSSLPREILVTMAQSLI